MPHILHLGIGNFHRAHQAWYTQNANKLSGDKWRITGVSLRRPDMRNALKPQNFRYALAIKDGQSKKYEEIDIHDDILVAPENPSAVVEKIADPNTKIVPLTVTEKGYYIEPATGGLDLSHPDVAQELSSLEPNTAIGYLVHGLQARVNEHATPITIISCDNLPENGRVLERLVREFSKAANIDLDEYLNNSVTFPNTMVDRIVPATDDILRDEIHQVTGVWDASPVSTETFSEWVIEDRFATSRPAWDKVGVTIVNDVTPFELRKLRLLNGTHSLMAYSGLLAGHTFVHEAVADPKIKGMVQQLMQEAIPTLPEEIRGSSQNYCDALISRFENPSLHHRLSQIAADGSLKLPVRILPVLKAHPDNGELSAAMQAVASWVDFVLQQLRAGKTIEDPNEIAFRNIFSSFDGEDIQRQKLIELLGGSSTV